jgi:ubiquinol-cytochrome c reductase cytochrome c subunit
VLLAAAAGPGVLGVLDAGAASAPLPPRERTVTDGQHLYQRDCAFCHGQSGQGTPRGQSLQGIGEAEVDYAVSTGRMPVRRPDDERRRRTPGYSRPQIDALLRYTAPFTAGGPIIPDVDPARGDIALGGEVFRAQCASCHQWAGEGGGLLGLNAPSLHDATPTQVGEAVRAGPVTMPAFSAATIDDHQLDSIAAYIEYLRTPEDRGGLGLWHLGPLAEGLIAWTVGMAVLVLGAVWIGEREPRP